MIWYMRAPSRSRSRSFPGLENFFVRFPNQYHPLHPCCCCSVAQSCPTLCDPLDRSTPVLPVLHYSRGLLKLMSIESVMSSNHLILCRPLLLPPSIFPSIRVFSSESALHIRWPKYWSFSFSTSPSNEYSRLISFRIDRLDLLAGSQVSNLPKRPAAPWRDKKLSGGTDGPPLGVGRMQKEQRTTGTPGPGSKSCEWCCPF